MNDHEGLLLDETAEYHQDLRGDAPLRPGDDRDPAGRRRPQPS
ncbi:hypothetical protein ABZW30_16265 [Kitasatospora sp. NPDC004669]